MPVVVRIVAFLMIAQLLCGFWIVALGAVMGFASRFPGLPFVKIGLGILMWQLFCSAVLIRPLFQRSPAAWAGVESILICTVLGSLSTLAMALARPTLVRALGPNPVALVRTVLEGALAVGFFGTRGWFGIGQREGWRVMWRRGWWALVVTGGLMLAELTALASVLNDPLSYRF
jgi:hypothetical protein